MSSMLEQAIVDARALKEAALKNAEALIVEKYAQEIKEAVNSLLEQEEEDPMADPLAQPGAAGAETPPEQGLHPTAAELPDSFEGAADTPIEINLTELAAEVEQAMGEFESHEDAAEDVEASALQEPPTGQPEAPPAGEVPLQENEEPLEEEETNEEVTEGEEIEINEEELLDLLEKMVVDAHPTKSGHMNRPDAELQHEEDIALAQEADTEVSEENEVLRTRVEEIEEQNKIVASAGLKIRKENGKLRNAVEALQEKLVQINVSNAKLLYINQTLSNTSLNERQKQKIVEAISKTESVKEAKVIFETLQSSVGILEKQRVPQSLSEAVNRRPSLMVAAKQRQQEKDINSPLFDRMQRLAGLRN